MFYTYAAQSANRLGDERVVFSCLLRVTGEENS